MGTAKKTIAEYSQTAKEKVESGLDSAYAQILSQPKTTFILLAIVSIWLGNIGTNFQEQIVDDVEVFLPEGAESTDLLLEVREEWSTDVAFIYIKTPNAEDPEIFGSDYNVTSQSILHEISWIEGDDERRAPGLKQNGLDWDKEDHGRKDGVLWIISIAQVIKEVNSSNVRFNEAMCRHVAENRTDSIFETIARQLVTTTGSVKVCMQYLTSKKGLMKS